MSLVLANTGMSKEVSKHVDEKDPSVKVSRRDKNKERSAEVSGTRRNMSVEVSWKKHASSSSESPGF